MFLPVLLLVASTAGGLQDDAASPPPAEEPPPEVPAEPRPPPSPAPFSSPTPPTPTPTPGPAPTSTGGPVRLLVLDLRNDGVAPQTQRIVGDALVVELTDIDNLEVLSSEDVRRMVDMDATRTAMGCDDTSCLAEIASALGAEVVVYGSIGTLGRIIVVTLNVFDSSKGKSVGRETIRANTLEELPPLVESSVARLVSRLPGVAVRIEEPESAWGKPWPYIAIAGIALGAGAGVVGGVLANDGYTTFADTSRAARDRSLAQDRIYIGLGVCVPGVVVAAASGIGLGFALSE